MQSRASNIMSLFNAKATWKHFYWELSPGEFDTGINLDNLQEWMVIISFKYLI